MSEAKPLQHKDRHSGVSKGAKKGGAGKGGWGKEGTLEEAYIPASDAFADADEASNPPPAEVVMVSKAVDNPNADVMRAYLQEGDLHDLEAVRAPLLTISSMRTPSIYSLTV